MTTFVVPYIRSTPNYIPRRDLVISSVDSVFLSVLIVSSDDITASPLVLDPSINLRMNIWAAGPTFVWDYGAPWTNTCWPVFWSGLGAVNPDFAGTFDFVIPPGTFAAVPPRCVFSLQLEWDTAVDVLARGTLNVMQSARVPA